MKIWLTSSVEESRNDGSGIFLLVGKPALRPASGPEVGVVALKADGFGVALAGELMDTDSASAGRVSLGSLHRSHTKNKTVLEAKFYESREVSLGL